MYRFAVNRPITTLMIFLSLVLFGVISIRTMNVNLYPDIDIPYIQVTTYSSGDMSYIKSKVTQKIEDELASIEGIKKIYSNSFDNLSLVTIEFNLKKDIETAANDVRDRMLKARIDGKYEVEKISSGGASIFNLFVSVKDGDTAKLMRAIDSRAKPFLQRISGVGKVDEVGFLEPQIRIFLNPFALDKFNLNADEVANVIKLQNLKAPLGKIRRIDEQISLKSKFDARDITEIENIRLKEGVFLKDVARVENLYEDEDSAALMNDVKGVMLEIKKVSGANALKTINNVKAKFEEFKSAMGEEFEIKIAFDKSQTMISNISQVAFDMTLGVFLTVAIVFAFLRNFSSTIISAIAIPVSIIGTFFIMHILGYDINRLTLIALTLGIGIFVDDAIVVVENISKKMNELQNPLKASFEGVKEIAFSVLGISTVLLCVFIPIAFMEGIVGQFFNSFAVSVAAGIVVSFFVSLMLIPTLAARVGTGREGRIYRLSEPFFTALDGAYERLLHIILKFKAVFIVFSLLVLIFCVSLAKNIGGDFKPSEDNSEFEIFFKADPSVTTEFMQTRLKDIMKRINSDDRVDYSYLLMGYTDAKQAYRAKAYVKLKPLGLRSQRQGAIMQEFREKFKDGDIAMTIAELPVVEGGDTQPVQLIVTGDSVEKLSEITPKIRKMLESIKGVVDIASPNEDLRSQIEISINKDKAKRLKLRESQIAGVIYSSFSSNEVGTFDDDTEQYDIFMRFDDAARADISTLKRLKIKNSDGEEISLESVAEFRVIKSPPSLDRFNRRNQLKFTANVDGVALDSVSSAVDSSIAEILPKGYEYTFTGDIEFMEETNEAFVFTVGLSAILIYIVLAALYESLILPLIIMISMPLAFGGVVVGLYLSGNSFSLFVMIGAILLFGMVGKNAILLVDFANRYANEGMNVDEAVIKAGVKRLHAILMTTFAMIFAMLPLALSQGAGYEGNSPMAIAIIAGLVSSTILTLLVVPALFGVVYRIDKKVSAIYKREKI